MKAFVLHHVHRIDSEEEDVKLIGVYSTRERAEAAQERISKRQDSVMSLMVSTLMSMMLIQTIGQMDL